MFSHNFITELQCLKRTAWTLHFCTYYIKHQKMCMFNLLHALYSVFTLLVGGHGGIPDSNRWRPEGAGH